MKIPKIILLIFTLALILRIYQLGHFPIGFHSDEARVAWNSYSILKTGKDDRGNFLSFYYNTFGDYRPTGIFYFTVPSLLIFGRNEFAVRFPSAFFGALTIFPLYFFVAEILKKKGSKPQIIEKKLALIASFLLAISPWHIAVSRATSEVVISTFFALSSMYYLVKLIKYGRRKDVIITCLLIIISFLLYHAVRLLAPLFFTTIILFYFNKFKSSKSKALILSSAILVYILAVLFTITPEAKMRFNQVSIPTDENTLYEIDRLKSENNQLGFVQKASIANYIDTKYVVYTKRFLGEYSTYFNSSFLIGNLARPYRYITPGAGLLTLFELIILVIGIVEIAKGKRSLLPLLLLLLAPIPAAVTAEDTPNLHRAFLMVPFLMIIEAYGLLYLINIRNKYKNFIIGAVFTSIFMGSLYFMHMYFDHSSLHKPFLKELDLDGSSYRNVGTKELVLKLAEIQNQYDKIVVTNSTDDPYPWYAFFTKKDPAEFNPYAIKRRYGPWAYKNIIFSQMECPTDSAFKTERGKKILVIDAGAPSCAYQALIHDGLQAKVVDRILRPDGSEVYVLLERK